MNIEQLIKSFTINGLFGTTNLHIPFEGKAKILIGENGLGKTQVLNMLYYVLTNRFERLIGYKFDSIVVEFRNGEEIIVKKSDIIEKMQHPAISRIVDKIGMSKFLELYDILSNNPSNITHAMRMKLPQMGVPYGLMMEAIDVLSGEQIDKLPLFSVEDKNITSKNIISKNITDAQILYFPTYRRVEEDLHNLGYDEDRFDINREDNSLIHFGMNDVRKRFNEVTQEISQLSKDGFSKISGEILSQLVRGLPKVDHDFLESIKEKDIEIILDRVGNQISEVDKKRIVEIITTKDIEDKDHSLLYFLQKLISIYDQQRTLDSAIKSFATVCNKYLVNKQVIYNESSIDIYIKLNDSDDELQLSELSSGEKQIISIFSKIYLSPSDCKFIVLFDEPELSLSVFWQRKLLPDIFDSGKCQFLLAVTHSPFIFENNLDKYAIGLHEYLSPIKLTHV